MNLLRATGMLAAPSDTDLAGVAWDRLVEEATAFRRAGGVVSLRDWAELERCERAALIEAYRVVESERAAAIGFASQGVDAAASVAAPADGGDAQKGIAMDRALASLVRRSAAASVPLEGAP